MEELHSRIVNCHACSLAQERTQAVPGEGSPCPKAMFVGEAPGANEDLTGRPFAGAAGKILDQMLSQAGLDRSSVFITSVLKCRPPKNRDPKATEVEACAPLLYEQINCLQPGVICPMGNHALHLLLGKDCGLAETHGRLLDVGGRTYFPLYHPAAAIYNRRLLPVILDDMQNLGHILTSSEKVNKK